MVVNKKYLNYTENIIFISMTQPHLMAGIGWTTGLGYRKSEYNK